MQRAHAASLAESSSGGSAHRWRDGWPRALAGLVACVGLVLGAGDARAQAPGPEEVAVQKHLGLFLTRPDRRDVSERVLRSQDRLEVWFQRTVPEAEPGPILCAGFKWLLAGRLEASDGVRGLFAALPEINEVVLVFYEVETRVEPQADGRYLQVRSAGPRARYAITRERARQILPEGLPQVLKGASCVAAGEGLIDTFWARNR